MGPPSNIVAGVEYLWCSVLMTITGGELQWSLLLLVLKGLCLMPGRRIWDSIVGGVVGAPNHVVTGSERMVVQVRGSRNKQWSDLHLTKKSGGCPISQSSSLLVVVYECFIGIQ